MDVIKNGLWNSVSNLFGVLTGIVGSVLVVRSLSTQEYGQFSYYIWLFGLFATFGSLSLPNALTKIRAEYIGNRQIEQGDLLARFVFGLLFLISALFATAILSWSRYSDPGAASYLIIIALLIVPNSLVAAMRSMLWSSELYRPVSIITAVASISQLTGIISVFLIGGRLIFFFMAATLPAAVQFLLLSVVILRNWPNLFFSLKLRLPQKEVLRKYFSFALPTLFVILYQTVVWQRSEIYFLNRFSPLEQVGFYNLSFTVYSIFLELGWALVNGYYPNISRLFGSNDWENIRAQYQKAVRLATLFVIPVCFGGLITIRYFITLFFGEKMLPAVPVAQVLIIGLFPGVICGVLNLMLSAAGGIWLHAGAGLLMSVVNICLDLVLIPKFHAYGAAWANTLSVSCLMIFDMVILARFLRLRLAWKPLAVLVLGGVMTALFIPLAVIEYFGVSLVSVLFAMALLLFSYSVFIWRSGNLRFLSIKLSAAENSL